MNHPAFKNTHPLIILAAISVIVFSLTATASMLGWLPSTASAESSHMEPSTDHNPLLTFLTPTCASCGTVESVSSHAIPGAGSKVSAALERVVGGNHAGNVVESKSKRSKRYTVTVRLDDGSTRTFNYPHLPTWRSGDRVKVDGDALMGWS
jgi:hypothetical protein